MDKTCRRCGGWPDVKSTMHLSVADADKAGGIPEGLIASGAIQGADGPFHNVFATLCLCAHYMRSIFRV
jgi:hypothetical protein